MDSPRSGFQFIAFLFKILKSEKGSTSVEAAIWMPIYMGIILVIANTSLVFAGQSHAMRVLHDGNRAFSIGRLTTEEEIEAFISERLAHLTDDPLVDTVLHDGVVYSTVQMPVQDLARIGHLSMFSEYRITVASQMFVEY